MKFFYIQKGEYYKNIFLGGLAIYTRINDKNEVQFYICYIPVWKKVYSEKSVTHCLFGMEIGTFPSDTVCFKKKKQNYVNVYLSKVLFQMNQVTLKRNEKIRIHFLYVTDSYWPSWKSLYDSCVQDSNIETKVVFLNTQQTDLFSSQHVNSEKFLLDNHISYIDYKDYMPELERPHLVIYQTPYNIYYEIFRKVRPDFMTMLGIRTAYISYGIEYDKSISNEHIQNLHYTHRVHAFAWRLFVMHQDIKEGFYEYCPSGGFHICVSGHPKFDCYFNDSLSLPLSLINKANKRKIIAFQIHCYNDSDCIGQKHVHSIPFHEHQKIMELLKTYKNYFFVYTIHPAFKTRNIDRKFCTIDEYSKFITAIEQAENMYLYTGNHQALLANADAFITENSSLMLEMGFFNKSILYLYDQPVSLKPFAEKLASTFHHGHTHEDVKNFMEKILFKNDELLILRNKYHNELFPENVYNGHIGQRIKEYIIRTIQEEKRNHKYTKNVF